MNIIKFYEKMYNVKLYAWQKLYLQLFYGVGKYFSREIKREIDLCNFLSKLYRLK